MSGVQDPKMAAGGRDVSVEDLRELTGAATPQFALQLRDRIAELIRRLDPGDAVRAEGERQIKRLEELAESGQSGGQMQDGEQPLPSLRLPGADARDRSPGD